MLSHVAIPFTRWEICHAFFSSADFLIIFFPKYSIQEYHQSVTQFGSRSNQMFCLPDLGQNCLQRLPAYDTGKLRVNVTYFEEANK